MTGPRPRAAIVLMAGLAGLGALAACGSVDVDVYREPTATTSAVEASSTTQAASVPGTTSGGDTASAAASGPATTAASAPVETRAEIVQLEGALLDGQQFDLAATVGNDVLLWFWAPW
ncbi:hypothetical protein [Candidatus Poriferisodalis sp.]|uniref:hypothetical protein n=1 Tax=Candidatus Poriferisodalis sp. TaxID=3101277 RepID=UPI003B024D9C